MLGAVPLELVLLAVHVRVVPHPKRLAAAVDLPLITIRGEWYRRIGGQSTFAAWAAVDL